MTKQEAIQIESEVEKLFSDAINKKCTVSMALTRALKVQIEENFINVKVEPEGDYVDWVHWDWYYSDLKDYINKIFLVIRDDREKIELLLKSYEMELED